MTPQLMGGTAQQPQPMQPPFSMMPGGPFDQGQTLPGGQRIPFNFDPMVIQRQFPNDRNTFDPNDTMSYLYGAPSWRKQNGI